MAERTDQVESALVPVPTIHQPLQVPSGPREYLRIPEIHFVAMQGAAQSARWSTGSLIIVEVPELPPATTNLPRSAWYVNLYAHTKGVISAPFMIGLCGRPWAIHTDEESLVATFEERDERYAVKAQTRETFINIMNWIAYIKCYYITTYLA
ncbi:hypothetical protein GSI_04565 [Ganoderma sinense ZZ0214-1]|uniref:Uncharacterized protein n=1 Tax=Ganoderma sinense ZZ0214-1 TaxID=1077348 RepID=A0A2G8SH76_9APHY|nr:hypothetical protein GSI_04565 [Ganoderma sinense ZZ0214-1]